MNKTGTDVGIVKLNDSTVALGGIDYLKKTLLLKADKSSENITTNSELIGLIKSSDSMLSIHSLIPQIPTELLPHPLVNEVKSLSLTADLLEGLALNTSIICKKEEAAQQINAMMSLFVGMGLSQENSPVKMKNVKMGQEKTKVFLNVKLSTEELTQALAPLMMMMPK